MSSSIDQVLSGVVEVGGLAGVVAGAANSDGPIYEGVFGERSIGGGTPMSMDTVLWIASMTKAVTGTAAMQLVEQGRLSLDGPASEIIAALGQVGVLEGFDEAGNPIVRPSATEITLRQLLTHTAGYGYDIWSPELARYQDVTGTPGVTGCENAALTTPLLFDPGTDWMYGINIDWVGKMVEAASGMKLGDYMKANIFDPLGMTSTSFAISPEMRSRLASVHQRDDDGSLAVFPFELPAEPEFQMGGGGLYSTVSDYLRFTRAFLNQGSLDNAQILAPETVALMSQNSMGELDVKTLHTAVPSFSNDANFYPDMQQKWGLSFLINTEETKEGRSAGSLSWAGLANSYYWIDPVKDICGVWATQLVPFADDVAMQNFRDFEAALYASL